MENELDALEDDDEPVFWEVVEQHYGRSLTEAEWRVEIRASYEDEFLECSEENINEELQNQRYWQAYKTELAAKEFQRCETERRAEEVVHDLYAELCSPPFDEKDEYDEAGEEAWIGRVNEIIRTRLEFDSLFLLLRYAGSLETKRQAQNKAQKRHTENHALRDAVYSWADANISPALTLDDAASAIAGKIVPLKWRTVREHLTAWKKLRAEAQSPE